MKNFVFLQPKNLYHITKISIIMLSRNLYLQQLIDSQGNGLVKTITGIRRCGKSVLLMNLFYKWLIGQNVTKDHIIDISFDDLDQETLRQPKAFRERVKSRIKDEKPYFILLDEVQQMENFVGVLLSLMHKPNCDIYVTGSNSRFLSTDIVTEFRGRSQEIHLQPLSFAEFMEGFEGSKEAAWREYYEFGGLPQILSLKTRQQKIEYLSNLVESVYIADLIERNRIKNDEGLRDFIRILASSIGAPSNPSRIAKTFESAEKKRITSETLSHYIKYLKEAFVIEEALRYDVKGRKYIGTETKYYFSDMGLRNSILGFRQVEENHLMENILYNELRCRGYNVDVGIVETMERDSEGKLARKRLEIDFVANQGSQRYYIQSAFRMDNEEKVIQEQKSLLNIPDSFKKIILVKDEIASYHDYNGILRMGLFDFLLNPRSMEEW